MATSLCGRLSFMIAWMLFIPLVAHGQISIDVQDGTIVLENDVIRHVIATPTQQSGPVQPQSFLDLRTGYDWIQADANTAWFELSIDNALIASADPIWLLANHERRTLLHGGEELVLTMEAESGPAAGLQVRVAMQIFPGSSLVRQHLVLSGDHHRLSHRNGEVYLIYPQYALSSAQPEDLRAQEIRIATWNAELLSESGNVASWDERTVVDDWRKGRDLSQNYMYHPVRTELQLAVEPEFSRKGPIVLTASEAANAGWITLYEHGAPDEDPEQEFLVIDHGRNDNAIVTRVRKQAGAYFDGEEISEDNLFSTVWTAVGPYKHGSFDDGEAVVWDYLLNWICEENASRRPLVYYNTWGMQRDTQARGYDPREILTIDRVLEDVADAHQLGIDLFVLDDGWQNNFGDWLPDAVKYPDGLAPLRRELEERDIMFGIWLATLATDSFADVARQNPGWLIPDDITGEPVIGRWDREFFCFVSDYRDHYVKHSKWLIDEGVRYFKWDGIDKHLCGSPHHHHGDESHTPEERRARYAYELIRYLTDAARELKDYDADVIIEFDITEPYRSVGLQFLSEARYFWMNNGASWYGDRSHYRAKSMRMVPSLYHGIIPPILQTAANYPHDDPTYRAQRYAVNGTLLGGYGFWGDLKDLTEEERLRVGEHVHYAQRVKETVARIRPEVTGLVGDSPEIYVYVDREEAKGQVIGFSSVPLAYTKTINGVSQSNLLGVLRNAYRTAENALHIDFVFPFGDSSREAFIVSNGGEGFQVTSSTSWLKDLTWSEGEGLVIVNGAPGEHAVYWPGDEEPTVTAGGSVTHRVTQRPGAGYDILIETAEPGTRVVIR